jgi:preprotein translocase subunit YajC
MRTPRNTKYMRLAVLVVIFIVAYFVVFRR